MSVKYEAIPEGYRIWKGAALMGVLFTSQHSSELKTANGIGVVWEAMPQESWNIHFTNPNVSTDDLKDIVMYLPTRASQLDRATGIWS